MIAPAICLIDVDGHVTSWSAEQEQLLGYGGDEMVGLGIEHFFAPEAQSAAHARELLAHARSEGAVRERCWHIRKDGSRFLAEMAITTLRDATGAIAGYASVTRNLSRRKSSVDGMSEARFRLLVEQVSDYAIFMLDPSGRVSSWNAGAQRCKGYEASEIIGRPFSCFYEEAEVRAGKCERELQIAEREGRFEEEGWRLRKDGTRFWASVVITALRDDDGALIGFAKVTRDLTSRREAEDERVRLAHAEESIRLRDEFLAIASHELKTPLTALQLQLQSLQERIPLMDDSTARKVERAARSGDRLTRLIESLLDVSLIAVGRFELACSSFDASELLTQLVDGLKHTAARSGSEITVRTPGPLMVRWDRIRIEQVITNLVANSIKYGVNGPITVSLTQDAPELVLEVGDRGPGLAEADLARIFGRFERAASLRHYGGLGLGLYITREIVEGHGGTISAKNLPEGGALFTVRLPIVARPPDRQGASSESQ